MAQATAPLFDFTIHVISNVRGGLPVYAQHRTYGCFAPSDARGQKATSHLFIQTVQYREY